MAVIQLVYFYSRSIKDLTVSYRVSVLGLPRSGKTALIAAIFDNVFSSSVSGKFSPAGQETISRVNKFIATLDARHPIPPTKESDVFVFRFLLFVKRRLLGRIRYEGEIVDFPGELSEKLLASAEDGSVDDDIMLFHREFFSWVLSSKVHLFVIDLAAFLGAKSRSSFAANISAQIRATWQILNEEIGGGAFPDRKVALVFTKVDLLNFFDLGIPLPKSEQDKLSTMASDAPPPRHPPRRTRDSVAMESDEYLKFTFEELVAYFNGQDCEFESFTVSAYRNAEGIRPGVDNLVRFILPHGVVSSFGTAVRLGTVLNQ